MRNFTRASLTEFIKLADTRLDDYLQRLERRPGCRRSAANASHLDAGVVSCDMTAEALMPESDYQRRNDTLDKTARTIRRLRASHDALPAAARLALPVVHA